MYIYNVTINVEQSAHDKWLFWMKEEYIPKMLSLGKFTKALMTKVMVEEEMGGTTYSVQYTTDSKATLEKYLTENANEMLVFSKAFQGKFVSFETELQVISKH